MARHNRVLFAYDERMLLHTHDWGHIECAARVSKAYDHLKRKQLLRRSIRLEGIEHATDAQLLTVHTQQHVDEVKCITAQVQRDPGNRRLREPDGPGGVFYSPAADSAARLACGCVISAALGVLQGSSSEAEEGAGAIFERGSRVEVEFEGEGWFPGTIASTRGRGSNRRFAISFDDGDYEADVTAAEMIPFGAKRDDATKIQEAESISYAKGDRVEVEFDGLRWFPGTVKLVSINGHGGNARFAISFDDGDYASDVAASEMRALGRDHAKGDRVEVQFDGDRWFPGTVVSSSGRGSKIRFAVSFDDGDYEPDVEASEMRALGARRDDENSNSENVLKEHAQQVQRAKRPHNPDALVSRLAFALVRPPGHHAGCDSTPGHHAEGFCFYNSVAVAAGVALDSGLAARVCIIDWDVHHGNGTQSIFWEDSRVLYISLHRYGGRWYPQTGSIKEEGAGRGRGYNVNIAWPEDGLTDSDYLAAFRLIVMPILEEFGPCLMLVSAGFDAGEGDVQGKMRVSPSGVGAFTRELMGLGVPTVLALEGGYNDIVTNHSCEAVLRALLGDTAPSLTEHKPSGCVESTLRAVQAVHSTHWASLRKTGRDFDTFFDEASQKDPTPHRISRRIIAKTKKTMRRKS